MISPTQRAHEPFSLMYLPTVVGFNMLRGLHVLGELLILLQRCFAYAGQVRREHFFRQAYDVGNRSLFFVTVTMGFTGAIMVIEASIQASRILGDLSLIGPAFLQLLVRDFGPSITALMMATRYGGGVAAEIGTMKTTEQIDALRMTGANPVAYLVAPRVFGGLLGAFPLIIFGCTTSFVAGSIPALYLFEIGWDTYFGFHLLTGSDVALGVAKALAFGLAVPLVSSYAGLSASGGAPGVGRATTHAVIGSSIAVLILDLVVGVLGFLFLP